MTESNFISELRNLNIFLTDNQVKQLKKYYELLVSWNEKINLTSIVEEEQVYLKHFYDSITLNKIVDLNQALSICDVGSGAGFPGMVLKIVFPNLKVTLVDSLNKRINFLNEVIDALKLENISTIHARIEDYAISNRNKFDLVTARAVAPLNILLEYCIPLVAVDSFFIPMKANINHEIEECNNALNLLDTKLVDKIAFDLPFDAGHRTLIKFQKKSDNKKFPRKNADIKKKPL